MNLLEIDPNCLRRFFRFIDKNGPVPAACPELGSCWLWTDFTSRGYGVARLQRNKRTSAHRMSFYVHNGYMPDGMVLHKCDVRNCVNPAHLFVGTHTDNMKDMVAKGRSLAGEKSPASILKDDEVIRIRELFNEGVSRFVLAEQFGVKPVTIHTIVTGVRWAHLGGPLHKVKSTHPNISPELKEKIREHRRVHGDTNKETAAIFGVHFSTIQRIISGKR